MDHKRPAFTHEQMHKVLNGLRAFERTGITRRSKEIRKLLRDYIHFVHMTGCRPGTELKNLRWSDIDVWNDGTDKFLQIRVSGKTGSRLLVASYRLKKYLDRIKRRQVKPTMFVFALPDGTQPKDLHGAMEKYLESINLLYNNYGQRFSLYSIRHTYATQRLLRGIAVQKIAKQMGTSQTMIERHYSKLTPMMCASELV